MSGSPVTRASSFENVVLPAPGQPITETFSYSDYTRDPANFSHDHHDQHEQLPKIHDHTP